jgi:hypothetical protein
MLTKIFDLGVIAVLMWLAKVLLLNNLMVKITNENAIAVIIAVIIVFITVATPFILRKK